MMSGIRSYDQGEILSMKVPFKTEEGVFIEKKRPVLVISSRQYNTKNNGILICPITSNIRNWEYSIFLTRNSLKEGNLPLTSELRVDLISNLKKENISHSIGFLKDDLVKKAIENIISLVSYSN